jgi:hypothetical protein
MRIRIHSTRSGSQFVNYIVSRNGCVLAMQNRIRILDNQINADPGPWYKASSRLFTVVVGDPVDPLLLLQGGVGEHHHAVLLDQLLCQFTRLLIIESRVENMAFCKSYPALNTFSIFFQFFGII